MTLRTRFAAQGMLGLLVLTPLPGAQAQELPAPETAAATGAYQVAWLLLAKGWERGANLPLFLGIRGGQGTAAWYCAPARRDCHHMWVDETTVRLTGDRLKGEIKGRMVKAWAPIAHVGDYIFGLDAKVSNGKVTGTFTAMIALKGQAARTTTGSLTGSMPSQERLKKEQGFPPGKDWPGYYGAGWAFRGPDCGVAMIEDLKDAKPGQADFGKDTQVLCYRLKDDGLERTWSTAAPYPAVDKLPLTIASRHVYIDGFTETFCLKLDTGEQVGSAEAGGARTQLMFAADGRVFIQPEGRPTWDAHGRRQHP